MVTEQNIILKIQGKYLSIVMLAAILPSLLLGGALYYLIVTFAANEIALPDKAAQFLYPVISKINWILALLFLLCLF